MYAIIEAGGKQHRVTEGERLRIDLRKDLKKGDKVDFDRVLMVGGDNFKVGAPLVEGTPCRGRPWWRGPTCRRAALL